MDNENLSVDKNVEMLAALASVFEGGGTVYLEYYHVAKDFTGDKTIQTCHGDIIKIVNALQDYCRLLEEGKEIYRHKLGPVAYNQWGYYADKCKSISLKYAQAIGYDYQQACIDCKKPKRESNVGLDGLTAWATKSIEAREEVETLEQVMEEQRQRAAEAEAKKRQEAAKKAAETRRKKKEEEKQSG